MTEYNKRHGGPYDRGSADSYYRRPCAPHYYVSGTGTSEMISKSQMTPDEIEAYMAGFEDNESNRNFKDWR